MEQKKVVNVYTEIILKVTAVILTLWFLYVIRSVVVLFFIAIIVMAAIEPAVDWIQGRKNISRMPRSVAVSLVYLFFLLILGTAVSFLIPAIGYQFAQFSQELPEYGEKFLNTFSLIRTYGESQGVIIDTQKLLSSIGSNLTNSTVGIFSTTVGVFSGVFSFIVIMVMAFYMSVKEDGMHKFLKSITPKGYKQYIVSLADKIKNKIGKWMLGQIFLMIVIFALNWIVLYSLGIPYALILAIVGGLLEIIPYLGPIIATFLAVTIGFLVSPVKGLIVLVFYVLIQQAENNIIVPQIMKRAVGLNPLAVILALLIGAKVAGILGAILAIPAATVIGVFVEDFISRKDNNLAREGDNNE